MTITTEEAEALAQHIEKGLMTRKIREALAALRTLAAERDQLRRSLAGALANLADASRARGEAEGKLAASEMSGVVEGWKARAERAESEAERLREVLKPFAKVGELFPDPAPDPALEFDPCIYGPAAGDGYALFGKDFRRARAALEGGKDADPAHAPARATLNDGE